MIRFKHVSIISVIKKFVLNSVTLSRLADTYDDSILFIDYNRLFFIILYINDSIAQFKLWQGSMYFVMFNLSSVVVIRKF